MFCIVIVIADNRLYDKVHILKADNLKISVENEQLRAGGAMAVNAANANAASKISQLENKLLAKQEELTELHKHKAENSQMIIDLGTSVERLRRTVEEKDTKYVCRCIEYLVIL